jgi:hypothetical protein
LTADPQLRTVVLRRPPEAPRAEPGQRLAIAAALAASRHELVTAVPHEMHRTVPGYGSMRGSGVEADLRAALTTIFDIFVALLHDDRSLSLHEERIIRAIGARRVRQGIPAEMLRGAVSVAARVTWQRTIECAQDLDGAPGLLGTVGAVGDSLAEFCEVILRIMDSASRSGERGSPERSDLLAEVLSGPPIGSSPVAPSGEQRLRDLLHSPHGLLLVAPLDACTDVSDDAMRAAVTALCDVLPGAIDVPVSSANTAHATLALAISSQSWAECLALAEGVVRLCPVLVFATTPVAGPARLRATYERATSLLNVARVVCTTPRVIGDVDVRLFSLLGSCGDDRDQFVDEVLGPVLRQSSTQRDRLLETIAALRNAPLRGGLRSLAKVLGVHEKTVVYRLKRIVELTRLDPDLPHQRAQLIAAFDLLRLSGWEPACHEQPFATTGLHDARKGAAPRFSHEQLPGSGGDGSQRGA